MSLKDLMRATVKDSYVIKPLELYLMSLSAKDEDRAINVNAPSQVGGCLRSRFYARTGAEADSFTIEPRTRRIFDNGTYVHERIQSYLEAAGVLLMREVPIINDSFTIQGHTDGILKLSETELGVLEIKSINSRSCTELKSEKPEHKKQGLIYLFCLEEHRKYLRERYTTEEKFKRSILARRRRYAEYYKHLKDGEKYTAEEKRAFQVSLCIQRDNLLYHCEKPITKVIFLYENKDTQDMKEYCVTTENDTSFQVLSDTLAECATLNKYVKDNKLPPREGRSKSDNICRWCNYKTECWN